MRKLALFFVVLFFAVSCLADDCFITTTLGDVLECTSCVEKDGVVYFYFMDKEYGLKKTDILSVDYVDSLEDGRPKKQNYATDKTVGTYDSYGNLEVISKEIKLLEDYGAQLGSCKISYKVTLRNNTSKTLHADMAIEFYDSEGFNIETTWPNFVDIPPNSTVELTESEVIYVNWGDIRKWKVETDYY
jgi:uncharacterized protein YcfL